VAVLREPATIVRADSTGPDDRDGWIRMHPQKSALCAENLQ
jgi:hypothetical protein